MHPAQRSTRTPPWSQAWGRDLLATTCWPSLLRSGHAQPERRTILGPSSCRPTNHKRSHRGPVLYRSGGNQRQEPRRSDRRVLKLLLGIIFGSIIIGKLEIHWLYIQCIPLCSYRVVDLLNRRSKALVPFHNDLTLVTVKLSTLKVKLHTYTYTQIHTLTRLSKKGVNPDAHSKIKNTERASMPWIPG